MTIQWSLVAIFLYCELLFIAILLSPFIPATAWHYLFELRFLKFVRSKSKVVFALLNIILFFLLFDSMIDMDRYDPEEHVKLTLNAENLLHLKRFRSQRNYYIAGFSIFLMWITRMAIAHVLTEATLMAETESTMRKAQRATEKAEKLLKWKKEKEEIETVIEVLEQQLLNSLSEMDTIKHQILEVKEKSVDIAAEYDQLVKTMEISKELMNS